MYEYTFPAVAGIQAGRRYYTIMLPLRLLGRLFQPGEAEESDPAKRSQRLLNKARVPEIAQYVTDNADSYVFSALTVAVDADFRFEQIGEYGLGRRLGILHIPQSARFVINDGQHRVAAIREALKSAAHSSLGDESIAVVLFQDIGLKSSQQRFADLNRHPVRPAPSITVLYDHREETAAITRHVSQQLPLLRDLTERERSTLPRRSSALITLSALNSANRALLHDLGDLPLEQRKELAAAYWAMIIAQFPAWEQVRQGKLNAAAVRSDFIHASGLVLDALGRIGNTLIQDTIDPDAWQKTLAALAKIDWRRRNAELWEGRATSGGRLTKSHAHVLLTTAAIRHALGMPLPPDEQWLEENFTARTKRSQAR